MNKNDLRYLKTDDCIRDAFLFCVGTIGFEKTKICDICTKARISRNTFYVHYEDKYDLMKSIYNDFGKEIFSAFEESISQDLLNYELESSVRWTLSEIRKRRSLAKLLLKCSKSEFKGIIEKAIIDLPNEKMSLDYRKKALSIEARLNKTYMLDALVGFIDEWLNNYDEISEEKAVLLLTDLCSSPVKKYFEKVL